MKNKIYNFQIMFIGNKSYKTFFYIYFLLLLITILNISCVERYYLNPQIANQNVIVVDALLNDASENQTIILSKATSPDEYAFVPLSGCFVKVIDTLGNEFPFSEKSGTEGTYEGFIDLQYLTPETKLMLNFITPDGKEYASDFEELLPCPPVDSVYYEIMSKPTSSAEIYEDGIQFYIDFNANENYSHYFRWQIDETWEYHSTWPIRDYIDENNVYHNSVADYSYYICYRTKPVDEIFTLNTGGLTQNKFSKYSLHFVNDHTQRLMYKYSLLIKQYSLSESAYNFWENLKKNNQESGAFFGTQPALVKGNVFNINDPNEEVLGYFGLSSLKTKRITLNQITQLSFDNVTPCSPIKPEGPLPLYRPLYFVINSEYGESECFDCRLKGGTTEKPDFWDK